MTGVFPNPSFSALPLAADKSIDSVDEDWRTVGEDWSMYGRPLFTQDRALRHQWLLMPAVLHQLRLDPKLMCILVSRLRR